jgi:hypothetical protein
MAMLGLTGSKLDSRGSRNVLMMQFAVGAAVSLGMVLWRYFKLKESKVRAEHANVIAMYMWLEGGGEGGGLSGSDLCAAVSLGMVLWRYFKLQESKVRGCCCDMVLLYGRQGGLWAWFGRVTCSAKCVVGVGGGWMGSLLMFLRLSFTDCRGGCVFGEVDVCGCCCVAGHGALEIFQAQRIKGEVNALCLGAWGGGDGRVLRSYLAAQLWRA